MTTGLSTKLGALAVALLLNGAIIGGVACLFSPVARDTALLAPVTRAVSWVALMPTI